MYYHFEGSKKVHEMLNASISAINAGSDQEIMLKVRRKFRDNPRLKTIRMAVLDYEADNSVIFEYEVNENGVITHTAY